MTIASKVQAVNYPSLTDILSDQINDLFAELSDIQDQSNRIRLLEDLESLALDVQIAWRKDGFEYKS